MEAVDDEVAADAALKQQQEQVGYVAARLLPPAPSKSRWRVQTFHDARDLADGAALPDEVRIVTVPPGLQRGLGLCE